MVRMRRAHRCGSYEWEGVSTDTAIGLKCLKCRRGVLLATDVFRTRLKDLACESD